MMNDKINKFSMAEIRRRHANCAGRVRIEDDVLVTCAISRSHKNKRGPVYCVKVSLNSRLMKQLGWKVSDYVDLNVDLPIGILHKVEPGKGVQLTGNRSDRSSRRTMVRFTLFDEMKWPSEVVVNDACTEVECDGSVVAFQFPQRMLTAIDKYQAPGLIERMQPPA